MIHAKETPVNWTAIGVAVTFTVGIVGVIGWHLADRWARQRDALQRQERLHRAISDFQITAIRWIAVIADKDQRLPRGFGVILGSDGDLHASALRNVRARSIPEIEASMKGIHPFLSAECKTRFEKEWQNYQEYEIEGVTEKDHATSEEVTSHDACKNGLITCLEQMKKIAGTV
jgi:hypothetical protein